MGGRKRMFGVGMALAAMAVFMDPAVGLAQAKRRIVFDDGGAGAPPRDIPLIVEGPADDGVPDLRRLLSPNGEGTEQAKVLKDLVEQLQKQRRERPDQFDELLKNGKFKDPAFLKSLEEMVGKEDFAKSLQDEMSKAGPGRLPATNDPRLKEKVEQFLEKAKTSGPDPNATRPPGTSPGPPMNPPNLPPTETPRVEGAEENPWYKWAERRFGNTRNSQKLMDDLVKAMERSSRNSAFHRNPDLRNGLDGVNRWMQNRNMKPPDLQSSSGGGPRNNFGGGGSTGIRGGGGSSGGSGFGSKSLAALPVIALIVGGLVAAFLLGRRWMQMREGRAASLAAGHARPAIDLNGIATREELVRAFNSISLDRCGEPARNWNHRVIAGHLGADQPARAASADRVAGLYEFARYAPAEENLSPGDYADARRELRVVAGGRP